MTPVIEISPSLAPRKIEHCWIVEMPKEIAEAFGLPEGSPVALFALPEGITAQMNLAAQTSEARKREPGWFIKMPREMAEIVGAAEGSILAVYAKMGKPYVEIYPPLRPDLKAIVDEILDKNKEAFEELKRLGD